MALKFEQFGVRRVELEVLMWPGFDHGYRPGELSGLYGVLNGDDLFETCELRATIGAEFESEHWLYDISTTRIRIRSESFQSLDELNFRVRHLIEETQRFLTPRRLPFLITDRILVRGVIPEDGSRDVSETLRTKVLSQRLSRKGQDGSRPLGLFPGQLAGTGLTLVGDTDDYHWHADIGPTHAGDTLPIRAALYFPPPAEAPDETMISQNLSTAYKFLSESVLEFAQTALS